MCFIVIALQIGCKDDEPDILANHNINLPSNFSEVIHPDDNAYNLARWTLGKKLFYDSVLSIDSTLSCASCHKSELSFSDNVAFSKGVKNRDGVRNAPSLANVAYHPYFTREGGVPTLEQQVLVPIQEHNEFDFNIVLAGERLAKDSTYVAMSLEAYNRGPDYYVITQALANFERSLISKSSSFDKFLFQNQSDALTASQKQGMELFYSNVTNCFQCHSGPNFTNYAFENNGLYESYEDNGRRRLTGLESDEARFKVASLRNCEVTSPYMFDGSINTLEEVIEHYNSGGKVHPNKSEFLQPLNLTEKQKEDLLAFLLSLTDNEFLTDPNFK
ncbi:MAG: cytochrome-c peroxidase [Bacteroidia bacterium]|nr:cytochrome-c peroxidase [Bacteroidia bacterium]